MEVILDSAHVYEVFEQPIEKIEPLPLDLIESIKKAEKSTGYSDKGETAETVNVGLAIDTILAHWENMALAVHMDVADFETAREMTSDSVLKNRKALCAVYC